MDTLRKRTLLALLIATVLLPAIAVADITYRWTDTSGQIHYRPTPPTDPDQPYVMMRDGVVVERFSGLSTPEVPDSEFEEERRREEARRKAEALLLVQFNSIADVDEAMEAQLAPIRQDYKLIDGTYASLQKSLFQQIQIAADRQRAGLPVSPYELEQVSAIRMRMIDNRESMEVSRAREMRIRQDHELKKAQLRSIQERQERL